MEDVFVTVVLDCSGSMADFVGPVTATMRKMFTEMNADNTRQYHVRLCEIGVDYESNAQKQIQISDVKSPAKLTTYKAKAMGGTPLYDGLFRVLNTANDPAGMGAHAILVLITDGGEGGSLLHQNWQEIRELIRDKVSTGWKFAYLAIGSEAGQQANQITNEVQQFGGKTMTDFQSVSYYSRRSVDFTGFVPKLMKFVRERI